LVLLALGAASRGASRTLGRVFGTAVVAGLVAGTALHLASPGHGREDVRGAGRWLALNVAAPQPLLVTSHEMAELARFHWRRWSVVDYPDDYATVDAPAVDRLIGRLAWRNGRAVYVFGRAWTSDPDGALERAVQRFPSCGEYETR